jgi:hypothetical protein
MLLVRWYAASAAGAGASRGPGHRPQPRQPQHRSMPTVRPLTQACAYEGYGGERARRGEDNQCLADKNIRTEKGWKKTATVIKAVKVALDAAGFKAPAASQQPASQQ